MPWVSIGVAALGAYNQNRANNRAANQQQNATNSSNQLQADMFNQSMAAQRANWDQTRADNQPYQAAGARGVNAMSALANSSVTVPTRVNSVGSVDPAMSVTGVQSITPQNRLAGAQDQTATRLNSSNAGVTGNALLNIDPGYQFRLQQGQQALERAAAARGSLGSGGFDKDLMDYAQGQASQEYQNAWARQQADDARQFGQNMQLDQRDYGRATDRWNQENTLDQRDWNQAMANDARRFSQGTFLDNRAFTQGQAENQRQFSQGMALDDRSYQRALTNNQNAWNRNAQLAQIGQNAVGQNSAAGSNYANAASTLGGNYANSVSSNLQNQANANAAATRQNAQNTNQFINQVGATAADYYQNNGNSWGTTSGNSWWGA